MPVAIVVLVLILLTILVGTWLVYKFVYSAPPVVKQGPGSKYGSQMLLNLLDVYQDWDYTDTRTPNVFEILPNSQMRVQYWDPGYIIGMSSYIATYTVVTPKTLRLVSAHREKILNRAPPASLMLTYVNDNQIIADDGSGPRTLSR